jgi:hypothetical protein
MLQFNGGTSAPAIYTVGVDLGDVNDYSSIVILERPLWVGDDESGWRTLSNFFGGPDEGGWVAPDELPSPQSAVELAYINMRMGRPAFPVFRVRHAERLPLGSGYPSVIDAVGTYMKRLEHYRPSLVVDHTGVGRPVIQNFRNAGLWPLGIHLHGGDGSRYIPEEHRYNVSVRELVASAQVMFQSKRLLIAKDLPHAKELKKELLAFRRKINPQTAHESFSAWREKDHDDLVFALSMCVWRQADLCEHLELDLQRRYFGSFSLAPYGVETEYPNRLRGY